MKTFDNSREGNDCWIREKWIWCNELRCVIKVTKVDGWCGDREPEARCFTAPSGEMPGVVFDWFNGGPSDD